MGEEGVAAMIKQISLTATSNGNSGDTKKKNLWLSTGMTVAAPEQPYLPYEEARQALNELLGQPDRNNHGNDNDNNRSINLYDTNDADEYQHTSNQQSTDIPTNMQQTGHVIRKDIAEDTGARLLRLVGVGPETGKISVVCSVMFVNTATTSLCCVFLIFELL